MLKRVTALAILTGSASNLLYGDFSYDQTTRISGGVAAMAGRLLGRLAEPAITSVMLKGNRMANVTKRQATVIDVDAETVTEINFDRKTYSVTTFAQMKEMLDQLTKSTDARGDFKVSAKETGQSKQIAGFAAKELVMTLEFASENPGRGESAEMVMTNHIWLAQDVPGSGELRAFHLKLAPKMSWATGGAGAGPGGAQMARGMAEVQKAVAKADGVPVLIVMKTTLRTDGQTTALPEPQARPNEAGKETEGVAPEARDEQAKNAKDAPDDRSRSTIAGALSGRLSGGLGGFGRKRKNAEPASQTSTSASTRRSERESGGASESTGSLMEMTVEASGFSSAGVDSSKFEVPAGFKKVDP